MQKNNAKNTYERKKDRRTYILQLLKDLFSIKNSIIYIITILISIIKFKYNNIELYPLGFAVLGASISLGLPTIIIYLITILATYIKFGLQIGNIYFLYTLIFLGLIIFYNPIKEDKKIEKIKLGKFLISSIVIIEFIRFIISKFNSFYLEIMFFQLLLVFIFYKIFIYGINMIIRYKKGIVYNNEEILSLAIILTLSIINGNKYVTIILTIILVILMGFRFGPKAGAIFGYAVGSILFFVDDIEIINLIIYTLFGIIAGYSRQINKIDFDKILRRKKMLPVGKKLLQNFDGNKGDKK